MRAALGWGWLLCSVAAWGHPMDEATITHTGHWLLQPGEPMRGVYVVLVGGLIAQAEWAAHDANGDQQLSDLEKEAWADELQRNVKVTLDGQPVAWKRTKAEFPTYQEFIASIVPTITLRLESLHPLSLGPHKVRIEYGEYGGYVSYFNTRLYAPPQYPPLHLNKEPRAVEFLWGVPEENPSAEDVAEGRPKASILPQNFSPSQEKAKRSKGGERLRALLVEGNSSPAWLGTALALALFLGALHALTPGHGKTIVAAYLVGRSGTVWDAIFLGLVVTFTHTSSVLLLGLAMLLGSQYLLPQRVQPYLTASSGLLITGMGLWLWRRARQGLFPSEGWHPHPHHGHEHGHEEGHHHPHRASWGELLGLGISGGMVPCPDALVVLLVAVGVGRIALGLGMIFAFSLGLAAVLIAIGIAMVTAKHLLDRWPQRPPALERLPALSALFIMAVGLLITWQGIRLLLPPGG